MQSTHSPLKIFMGGVRFWQILHLIMILVHFLDAVIAKISIKHQTSHYSRPDLKPTMMAKLAFCVLNICLTLFFVALAFEIPFDLGKITEVHSHYAAKYR